MVLKLDDCDESIGKPLRQILMLVVTEKCNLRCSYCYERKDNGRAMSIEDAQANILAALANPESDELEIIFFGGEPFAAFNRISKICDWLWSSPRPKPYICFSTTNGTLVHGKIKQWLDHNKERFVVGLSLDGTPEMHDRNRSNSFRKIDIDFFRKNWPKQPVKMTISPESVANLADGVIWIHRQGFELTSNPAEGLKWEACHFEHFERELRKLADFYLEHPDTEPIGLLCMRLDYVPFDGIMLPALRNYCGTGRNLSAVSVTGKIYPCQTFMPMSGAGEDIDEAVEELKRPESNRDDHKCTNCKILRICPTCYGLNYVHNGSPFLRSADNCRFQRIRVRATTYLWANMIACRERGYAYLAGKSDLELARMIDAVRFFSDDRSTVLS